MNKLNEEGPKTTTELYEAINNHFRHGCTSQCLGNLLAKSPDFKKLGMSKQASMLSGSYNVCVWTLSEN
jgi:hypothetical protein